MIEKIKDSFKEEWKDLSFKILVIILIPIVLLFSFSPQKSLIKLISLLIFIIVSAWNTFENFKKENNNFNKIYSIYQILILTLFWLIYTFYYLGKIVVTVLTTFFTSIVVIIFVGYFGYILLRRGNHWLKIAVGYIGLALSIIAIFSFIYVMIDPFKTGNLLKRADKEVLGQYDPLYFSSVTFYTLGYGDIYPKGDIIQLASQIEVMIGSIIHIIILGWVISNNLKE